MELESWVAKKLVEKVYCVQCIVYIDQCTVFRKVLLLSLWMEPQCSLVWGVEPFAKLLLCLTPSKVVSSI